MFSRTQLARGMPGTVWRAAVNLRRRLIADDPRIAQLDLRKAIKDAVTPEITRKDVTYFIDSSLYRAKELARLAQRFPMQQGKIVEHGCALGLMSLCVMKTFPQLLAEAHGSEIKQSFIESGRRLWKKYFDDERLVYQQTSAQRFVYPRDVSLITFAQLLFKMPPPERKAITARAIKALKPGGILIVNEILAEPDTANHGLCLEEMRAMLPGMEMPYTPRRGFHAKDRKRWPPDTFFVYRNPL